MRNFLNKKVYVLVVIGWCNYNAGVMDENQVQIHGNYYNEGCDATMSDI